MAKLSKYNPQLGSFVKTAEFRASRNKDSISLTFKHGDFVYTVFTVILLFGLHNFQSLSVYSHINVCLVAMIHCANLNGRNLLNIKFQGESGEARVARVCENDQGYDGSFMTDRYGGLSCNHLEVNGF